jgi:threonylcarbamoyladenosine tRNA methylthiotransferase MtaB
MEKTMRFAIHTLGCKVNQYESEKITSNLIGMGWEFVDFAAQPDVFIINSCTVTSVASHKSRQLIRRAIKGNSGALVVVAGCYADADRAEIEKIAGVGLVVGNGQKDRIPRLITAHLGIALDGNGDKQSIQAGQHGHTRALVKVQDGCDNFCTYCIVPYVRGDLWSRPADDVVAEVRALADGGTQEIVLTGIHLGLYGAGIDTDLGGLLARLVEVPNLGRIRLSSIELNEVSPQIIELMATSGKMANHLHIPLQSGSDAILKRMNRHYTAEEFIARARELQEKIENVAISTDIIVGFPGETDADFAESLRVVKEVGFSKLHVFKYSLRKGTPAATYDDQIPGSAKDARSMALINAGHTFAADFAARYVGKRLSVLIERGVGDRLSGVSDNYVRVYAHGPREIIGTLADIEIIEQEDTALYGRLVWKR